MVRNCKAWVINHEELNVLSCKLKMNHIKDFN